MNRTACPLLLGLLVLCANEASAQTAFRFTDLDLRDPHTWASLPLFGCRDITDQIPFGLGTPFNESILESIELDKNGDGSLDLNGLIFFVPTETVVGTASHVDGTLWNPDDAEGELIFHFGLCTPPAGSPICEPDLLQPIQRWDFANEDLGPCLGEVGSSLSEYEPNVVVPSGPCFFGEPFDMVLPVGGIPLPLEDMQIGATYVNTFPPRLMDGLLRGFLREAAADSIILPETVPLAGGEPLSSMLRGSPNSCASGDDREMGPDSEMGWWLYFNFEADEVPFSPATAAPTTGAAPTRATLSATPNPFSDRVSFLVHAPRDGRSTLQILDVRGRRVRTLTTAIIPGATRDVVWDGTNGRGQGLPPGVYFARLETPDGVLTRKIVRTR